MEYIDSHGSDEVGIFKGFRVHKDSHGGLFMLKKKIRHYLSESDRNKVQYLDHDQLNHLPEGENVMIVKQQLTEPRKIHKHTDEFKKVGIFTQEGHLYGKEVFTGVYGGQFLFENGQKIRLEKSALNYVEDINKDKEEKKKIGIYIGKGKKHGHLVFQGKLGELYCKINEQENLIAESEKKYVDNFKKLKARKKNNTRVSDKGNKKNDSETESDSYSNDNSDEDDDSEEVEDSESESVINSSESSN